MLCVCLRSILRQIRSNALIKAALSSHCKTRRGRYAQENRVGVGVYGPCSKTLTLFKTKIRDLPYSLFDLIMKPKSESVDTFEKNTCLLLASFHDFKNHLFCR